MEGHVDRDAFLKIMTAFPTGVAVITTTDGRGVQRGLTSNAVTSASVSPPLLLVCVDKNSRTLPALIEAGAFVVNFMADNSEHICCLFASKAEEKFTGISWTESPSGFPVLHEHTLAWAECALHQHIEVGDHIVLVGLVRHGETAPLERRPISYFRRAFQPYPVEAAP